MEMKIHMYYGIKVQATFLNSKLSDASKVESLNIQLSITQAFAIIVLKKNSQNQEKNANCSQQLLEIIHSNVFNPFPTLTFNGDCYFVTFVSCFGYIFKKNPSSLMF